MAEEKTKSTKKAVSKDSTSKSDSSKDNSDSKLMAALSYISFLSVIMYVVKKDDEYVVFHSKQGMVIFGIAIVNMLIVIVPVLGWILSFFIWIAILIASIIGFIKAFEGEKYKMPFVYDLSKKINF